jgi:hypothetical protein
MLRWDDDEDDGCGAAADDAFSAFVLAFVFDLVVTSRGMMSVLN